jgi:hypothetical protein
MAGAGQLREEGPIAIRPRQELIPWTDVSKINIPVFWHAACPDGHQTEGDFKFEVKGRSSTRADR